MVNILDAFGIYELKKLTVNFKNKNQRKYPTFRSHPDFIIKDFIQVEIQGLIEHKSTIEQ